MLKSGRLPNFTFLENLISIILPVKNAAPWLDDCLQSIAAQSEAHWECILIDDHSTDNSIQRISGYSFFDTRFRVVENKGHGLIAAYQTGWDYARGAIITRMDADDVMPPDRLRQMKSKLLSSKLKTVITGKVQFFPAELTGPGTRFYENWLNERMDNQDHWEHVWRECVIPSPCWMTRKDDLHEIGAFEDLQYPEDQHLAFRFFEHGFQIESVPEICHLWRQHDKRYSRISSNYAAEKFTNLKWHYFKKMLLPAAENLYVLGTGDKAKYLVSQIQSEAIPFIWISHQKNIAGNRIAEQQIHWLNEIDFPNNTVVISTLSSIDNFEKEYSYLKEKNVAVFRFC